MRYKIAVASSDEEHINVSFGAAFTFLIYEVEEDNSYHLSEKRVWNENPCRDNDSVSSCLHNRSEEGNCGSLSRGCGGAGLKASKLELVEDCRCLISKKIGFEIQKQLEKRAIAAFSIECKIEEALEKIVSYFDRVDNHRTLRGLR